VNTKRTSKAILVPMTPMMNDMLTKFHRRHSAKIDKDVQRKEVASYALTVGLKTLTNSGGKKISKKQSTATPSVEYRKGD